MVHVHPLLLSQDGTGNLQGCDVSGAGCSCLSPGEALEQPAENTAVLRESTITPSNMVLYNS